MKRFIVLFSAVILCLTLAGCSGSQYKKATELYEQGNYAEAGEIFSKLGNYEDSADKANECKYQEASALLQNSDYDAAKALFSALGDYGDSADKVKFCDYKKAEKLLADDDYDAAKAIFSALGSYENSADQVKECDYEKAEELFNQEKYEEALKIYETISEYKTSKERIITINSKFLYETYGDIIDLLDNTGYETVQGFSIKSRLGSPSTLVNAGKTTNFVFEVTGNIDDAVVQEFNTCSKKFKDRFEVLDRNGCDISYDSMENDVFESNLQLIDGDLPKICGYMLKEYYSSGVNTVTNSLESLNVHNPIGYDLSKGHPFYEYKFKKFLAECALGMLPSKVWDGTADATGGYIIVREDGEVLCYHLFNRNEFETYLINNTKFETASTSRHEFGSIYKDNGKYYIKLNLQVRFIK